MTYAITPGSHPDFYILTYSDDIEYDELLIDEELHLNEGRPIYLLVDTSQMNNTLPDRFLDGIVKSFVVNRNIAHIAAFIPSPILRVTGHMVVKITRRQKQITIHHAYEEATQMIETLLQQRKPSRPKRQASS